jgi:hypothetical protein
MQQNDMFNMRLKIAKISSQNLKLKQI